MEQKTIKTDDDINGMFYELYSQVGILSKQYTELSNTINGYSNSITEINKQITLIWEKINAVPMPIPDPEPIPDTEPTPDPTPIPVINWRGDWESGLITGPYDGKNWSYLEASTTSRYSIVTNPIRQGKYAARCEIKSTDKETDTGVQRTEVSGMRTAKQGVKIWENENSGLVQYCFSTMFDSTWKEPVDYNNGRGKYCIFMQVHGPDFLGANPTFSLSATDKIRIGLRVGDINGTSKIYYDMSDGALNIGKWIDWKLTTLYKSDNTGYFILERRNQDDKDFKTVWSKYDTPTLQYDHAINGGTVGDHYVKYGLYRNTQAFDSILYNDGFTRATII